jgi:chromosome segregation ATPase
MAETLFKGEAEGGAAQVGEPAREPATLALSADDFAALEDRVLRAVELVRRERSGRTSAEERARHAEVRLSEQSAHIEQLERDAKQLHAERDHVRQRIEKLLKQLDSLEM